MELTVSTASTSEITKFSLVMGIAALLVAYIVPFGGWIRSVPGYITALTMGPLWGVLASVLGSSHLIVYLPNYLGNPVLLFQILYYGPIATFGIGILGLKLRPIISLIIAGLSFDVLLLLMFVFAFVTSPSPHSSISTGILIHLVGTGLQLIPLLITWVCISHPALIRYYPGYTPALYETIQKQSDNPGMLPEHTNEP